MRSAAIDDLRRQLVEMHRRNDFFTERQCRQANDIIDRINMATKSIGRVDAAALAKGKVKPKPAHMSVPKKAAAKAKADRKEAGLRANRKGKV